MVQPALPTREALALGVTRRELQGRRWTSPFRGVHLPAHPSTEPLQCALAAAELVPDGGALGGWAAAQVLGCRALDGRAGGGMAVDPIVVVTPPPLQIRRRSGIEPKHSTLDEADVATVNGITVTSPVRTAFDCARWSDLTGAVVALDALARECRVDLAAVADYVALRPRWRGVPIVRAALDLADPRAKSPGESRMRVLWVVGAGLPRPEVNATVLDVTGCVLGEADLLDVDAGVVGEYDGAQHRELEPHADDNAREEWLEDAGLIVARLSAPDMTARRRTRSILRLRTAHARGLGRDRARDRWLWRAA
jgi:hypothetical protein